MDHSLLALTPTYALRAMAVLANLDPGETLTSSALSERTGVPVHYLSKIMRRMVVAGLASSRKGHGGGFALGRPPHKITFAAILAATDLTLEPGQCGFGFGSCDPRALCPLHPTWSGLQSTLQRWAEDSTLADTRSP